MTAAATSPLLRGLQWLVWRLQSLLSTYLPVFLMAFLASGTWWLIKNTPTADAPGPAKPLRHDADYQMKNFELQRLDPEGRLQLRIEGSELRHYPDTDTLEIDGVRLRGFGLDRSMTVATAKRAISNGDGSEMQLLGDVRVLRYNLDADGEPQKAATMEIRGDFLRGQQNGQKLSSHLPVKIFFAGGEVQARSFEYDHLNGKLVFSGHTTGRFDPPGSRKERLP
ncbi:MAG: LPS export ABC transporter periplasmic protein LptC [Burkholderiaceae bacterium]